jgi:hypothetical protein
MGTGQLVVGIATRYGLGVWGSNPGGGRYDFLHTSTSSLCPHGMLRGNFTFTN